MQCEAQNVISFILSALKQLQFKLQPAAYQNRHLVPMLKD